MNPLDLIEEQAKLIVSKPDFSPSTEDLLFWFSTYWEVKEAAHKAKIAENSK